METIISSLIRQEVIANRNYVKWTILQGENIDNSLSIGTHEFSLLLEADDNECERVELTLNVVSETDIKSMEEKLSFFQKIAKWFSDLWKKIVAFFSK